MMSSTPGYQTTLKALFCLSLVFTGCVKDNRAIDDLPPNPDGAMTSGMGDGGEVGDDSSVLDTDGDVEDTDAGPDELDGGTLVVVDASEPEPEPDMNSTEPDAGPVEPPVDDLDLDGVPDDEDNCPDVANADQRDEDENGVGDLCELLPEEDDDQDGVLNRDDNCPLVANNSQTDDDDDGIGNRCDNCPDVANQDQADRDGNGQGDVCADVDGDGVLDAMDNCVDRENPSQVNDDDDAFGNACDNCPDVSNPDQADANGNGIGDECEPEQIDDADLDGVADDQDNCPRTLNRDQRDADDDGVGDACDNCPTVANANQAGGDIGDACRDTRDLDEDGVIDAMDNCPRIANAEQRDLDDDGVGNACDNCGEVPNNNQLDSDSDGRGDACDELVPQLIVELSWGLTDVDFDLHMVGPRDTFGSDGDCWASNRRFGWCNPGYQFDYPNEGDRPYEQIRVGDAEEGWHTVGIDRYPNDSTGLASALVTIRCGENMPISFGPYVFGVAADGGERRFLEAVQVNPETCETNEVNQFGQQSELGGVCSPANCSESATCDINTGECIDLCGMISCDDGFLCDPEAGECVETPISDWGNGSLADAPYCETDADCEFNEVCYRVPVVGGRLVCGIPCGQEGDVECPEDFFCCDYRRARDYCVPEGEQLGQSLVCQ